MRRKSCNFAWLLASLAAVSGIQTSLLPSVLIQTALAQGPAGRSAGGGGGGGGGCQHGGRGGGMMSSQGMMMQAASQLSTCRQQLSEAESTIASAQSRISASSERLDGARQAIVDAKTKLKESTQSQRSIEADILASQGDDSPYAKASSTFLTAQVELKVAREAALKSDDYLARRAAAKQADDPGPSLAKLQRDTLADDVASANASEKLQRSRLAMNRIKLELFGASEDWVAASSAAKTASAEESKASGEARRGALGMLPAKRELREAQFVAERAKSGVAQAESTLRAFAGPRMPGMPGMPPSPPRILGSLGSPPN